MTTTTLSFSHPVDQEAQRTEVVARPATGAANRLLHALFRGAVLALALIFGSIGFAVLSSPLAVPFTVAMWMGAAGTIALGIKADLSSAQ